MTDTNIPASGKRRFDFDRMTDRSGTDSLKWKLSSEDEIPLWVADMDFEVAPEITGAIVARARHGIFGYSVIPPEWEASYRKWWLEEHNYRIPDGALVFCTGVVPAISSLVRKLTTPAEKVLIQTPVYNIFFNCILNQGRFVVESPLDYRDGRYEINFERLETDLSDPQCSMMILCNPHNPVGKIWSKEELARIGELCHKYGVTVISDEIHCDLTVPGKEYVPFASVNELCAGISVTCIAPSKTFNMAGLCSAAVMAPDPRLRYKASRGLNTDECAEPNAFAVRAAIAAWTYGKPWLEELKAYLEENRQAVFAYLKENVPELTVIDNDATYLLWIDVAAFAADSVKLAAYLRKHHRVWLSPGTQYGAVGKHFVRLNIAAPRARLMEGVRRFAAGVRAFGERNKE